jgi:FMN phosphatase YigB (HAD superfamily)
MAEAKATPPPSKLKTLVIDLDETLIHTYWKQRDDEIPIQNAYKSVETPDFIIFINHILVQLIKDAKAKGVKIVLWTTGNTTYMDEVLSATKLDHLFDYKLNIDNAPSQKVLKCATGIIIPPMLIIDDTKEKVWQNEEDEYLVVEDFMEQLPLHMELEYLCIRERL